MPEWYGPWQEGRTHEEIIHAKITVDDNPDPVHELISPAPTRQSGWRINWRGFGVTAAASWEHAGGISSPPDPRPDKSLEAFVAAKGTPVTESGSAFQYEMSSYGGRNQVSVGQWTAHHGWEFAGMEYRLGYTPAEEGISALYSIPPGMDNITEEYAVQLEPWVLGETARIELLSLEVTTGGNLGDYGLFCKPLGDTAFLHHGPVSISESQMNIAPYEWDQPTAQGIMHAVEDDPDFILPGVSDNTDHPDMPRLSWLYKGPNLADPHFNPSTLVSSVDGMPVDIKVTYQFPRWRQVFFDGPPDTPDAYRRIFPRDDGLGAGGRRSYPRSKARQSSNRISGGYL